MLFARIPDELAPCSPLLYPTARSTAALSSGSSSDAASEDSEDERARRLAALQDQVSGNAHMQPSGGACLRLAEWMDRYITSVYLSVLQNNLPSSSPAVTEQSSKKRGHQYS